MGNSPRLSRLVGLARLKKNFLLGSFLGNHRVAECVVLVVIFDDGAGKLGAFLNPKALRRIEGQQCWWLDPPPCYWCQLNSQSKKGNIPGRSTRHLNVISFGGKITGIFSKSSLKLLIDSNEEEQIFVNIEEWLTTLKQV